MTPGATYAASGGAAPHHFLGKPPQFTGVENVDGFLRSFEGWATAREVPTNLWYNALQGALKKDAQQFEYNLAYVGPPTYAQLKSSLLENYGETSKMFYYELQDLRRGNDSVAAYNEKFCSLVSKAKRYLPTPFQEVEVYIRGIWPRELQTLLRTRGPKTLQEAMEVAILLEPSTKANKGGAIATQKNERCRECGVWKVAG